MENYSVYSYRYTNNNGKENEESKSYSKRFNGDESFRILEKENKKVKRDVRGNSTKTSNSFIIKSNRKVEEMERQRVYQMLIKEFGVENQEIIKDFIKSKEYKQLENKTIQKGG